MTLRPGETLGHGIAVFPFLKTSEPVRLVADDGAKGHRLGSRQRRSGLSQLLTAESKPLRCPRLEENARMCAAFSISPQRTRKSRTGWRRGRDSNWRYRLLDAS